MTTGREKTYSSLTSGSPGATSRRPLALVDDVHAVVLPVRPGDPEDDAQPAPEPEPPFPGQRPLEHERIVTTSVVAALDLPDAVHVDLDRARDIGRQVHPRLCAHPS